MTQNTDFGVVAQDLQRAAVAFAALTSAASAFGSSLREFRDFERQLTLTNAIAGGTVEQFERMKQAARDFSLSFTTSAIEAGQALQNLAQAGFSAEESLQSLSGVLLLAQATFTDIGTAADLVTSNIRAFGLAASDTNRVANTLTAATTSSLATIDKLAFAFRQVAPVANLANLSIEETTALLNQLFNVGLRGEQAGTALRNIIIRLVRPLGEAQEILRNYGIATRDAAGNLLPLVDIFNQLREAGVTNAELARIFETEALAGVVTLLNATAESAEGAASAYQQNLEAISGTDRALEIAVQNLSTFDAEIKLLQNTIRDLQKDLGERFAGVLTPVITGARELIETFRGLPEPLQNTILAFGAIGVAALSLLATINALALVFGGVGFRALTRFGAALFGAEKVIEGTARRAGILRQAFVAMLGILGNIATAFGPVIAAIGRFTAVAISLTPQGRIIRGLITLSGLLIATSVDWENWGNSAADALEKADLEKFNRSKAEAALRADDIISEATVRDVASRVENIRRVVEEARNIQSNADNIGTGTRQAARARTAFGEASGALEQFEAEFEELERILDIRERYLQDIEAARERAGDRSFLERFTQVDQTPILQGALRIFLDGLDAELKGALAEYDSRVGDLEAAGEGARAALQEALKLRSDAVAGFLEDLADPEVAELDGGQFASVEPRIRQILQDTNITRKVLDILNTISNEDEITQQDIVTAVLNATGTAEDAAVLAAALNQRATEQAIALQQGLEASEATFLQELEEIRIALLKREVDQATSVAEAVAAAREAGFLEFENQLEEVGAEAADTIRDSFETFFIDTADGYREAVEIALAAGGLSLNDIQGIPGFADVVGGQIVIDAINDQINASTTDKQAQAIIDAEFEKFANIMNAYVNALIEAGIITGDQEAAVRATVAASTARLQAAFVSGLNEVSDAGTAARQSATRRLAPSRRGGGGGGDPAKKALQDARKLEDAFSRAAREANQAARTYAQNIAGIDPNVRIELLLDVDLERITLDAERKITQLKRQLEDFRLDGNLTPELERQINRTIELVELEKQAQIDSATSFEAQMQRRSQSLDVFIRDLETLAFQSESTFDKVAAGIGKAFAEYQKDLVTLVDITSNAVTGFLDAVTTGVADFIFDNENAWENFKATMLDISREIFEGFTRALIQQSISSLTGGGGSIFGNALQPSSVGGAANQETPSVGTGGLLGGLFGNLFGGGQQAGAPGAEGAISAAPIQQGVQQVSQALQQGAVQINQALQSVGVQTRAGGQQVGQSLQQTSSQVRPAGQQTAQALQQAGQQIGQAANQAASNIQSSGTGFGSGGGGFLGSLFSTALSFFKDGGPVGGPTYNYIRQYAEGGSVVGPGTGTSDSILAMLSNGEFVVNAKSTREFGPLLEAINSGALKGDTAQAVLDVFRNRNRPEEPRDQLKELFGSLPKFAEGGLVGDRAFGSPSVNLTEPRTVLINNGTGQPSNNTTNNVRGGDVINVRVVQNVSGSQNNTEQRRSADQLAKRLGQQIERSKKNA